MIDRERTEALAAEIMQAVRPVLATAPPRPENVFVALNAIAFVVATIVAGADHRALEFFINATVENFEQVRAMASPWRYDA